MTAVNREICKLLIARNKWQDTLCVFCSVRKRADCENLKVIREKEDRKYEELNDKFDERRELARGVSDETET